METNFNGEGSSEATEFEIFSIRAYVAEVCRRDWKKCWPFDQSLAGTTETCPPLLLTESCFSDQDHHRTSDVAPDVMPANAEAEATNSCEDEICKDKQATCGIPTADMNGSTDSRPANEGPSTPKSNNGKDFEHQIEDDDDDAVATVPSCVDANYDESGESLRHNRKQRYLSLSGILESLAGPSCGFECANSPGGNDTDDNSDDNITLDKLLKRQKGVQVNAGTVLKKRKMMQIEEPRQDQLKRLSPGFNASNLGPKVQSKRSNSEDLNMQTPKRCKKSSVEVRQSSSRIMEDNGAPPYSGSEANTSRTQQDHTLPLELGNTSGCQARESLTRSASGERADEDSVVEVVKLLMRRFEKEDTVSRTRSGVKTGNTVQSTTGSRQIMEPLEAQNHVHTPTAVSGCGQMTPLAMFVQEKNPSGPTQSARPGDDPILANVNLPDKDTGRACACIQKKIREKTSSDIVTKDPTALSASTQNKFMTTQLAEALSLVQGQSPCQSAMQKISLIPWKGTGGRLEGLVSGASGSMAREPHVEVDVMNVGAARPMPRGCGTLVCSMNRNPADFSIPDAGNVFMRGG